MAALLGQPKHKEETIVDAFELVNKINGIDGDNTPKAMIGVYHYLLDDKGEVKRELENSCLHKPVINIQAGPEGYTVLDIEFDSDMDTQLAKMNKILMNFSQGKSEQMLSNEEQELTPTLVITLVPVEEAHNGYVMAYNPLMYCLCAADIRKPVSCLRLLFKADNVMLYETEEDLDFAPIESSVQMEIRRKEEQLRRDEEQRQKRQDFLNYQNELAKKHR